MSSKDRLEKLIPRGREVLFACIGTDRSTGDSLGPLIGRKLSKKGYTVIGTIHNPLHALNLEEGLKTILSDYPNHFIVAIDACLGHSERIGKISVKKGPIQPGLGVGKELPPIGDVSIRGVVNVAGFMEHAVLQSTRLSVVLDIADEITEIIDSTMRDGVSKKRLLAGSR